MKDELTRSTLFHFFYGGCEYIQHFNRYLHHFVRHSESQWDPCIDLQLSKESLYTPKEVDKEALARSHIFSCLKTLGVHEGPQIECHLSHSPREERQRQQK